MDRYGKPQAPSPASPEHCTRRFTDRTTVRVQPSRTDRRPHIMLVHSSSREVRRYTTGSTTRSSVYTPQLVVCIIARGAPTTRINRIIVIYNGGIVSLPLYILRTVLHLPRVRPRCVGHGMYVCPDDTLGGWRYMLLLSRGLGSHGPDVNHTPSISWWCKIRC